MHSGELSESSELWVASVPSCRQAHPQAATAAAAATAAVETVCAQTFRTNISFKKKVSGGSW